MFENIYIGNKLVSVKKGEHYGEVVRDAMTGDIILIEDGVITALGCTADSSEKILNFWERKLLNKVSFRLSRETFKNTGLNKAVVLPSNTKRKFDEPSKKISLEEELYYSKKDLGEANMIIETLKSEIINKEQKIKSMLDVLKNI